MALLGSPGSGINDFLHHLVSNSKVNRVMEGGRSNAAQGRALFPQMVALGTLKLSQCSQGVF